MRCISGGAQQVNRGVEVIPRYGDYYESISLKYLKEAIAANDTEKLIRYVRLHFGDSDDERVEKMIYGTRTYIRQGR
ncbi:MAG: hypothetical protein WKF74_03310 [Pyrinomonadaceae bacterium]